MCVLSIKVPIWKKSGNLFNDPHIYIYIYIYIYLFCICMLNKFWRQHPTRHQLYGHLPPITKTIKVRWTRHAGHCWRSKDELISDVLLWTPTFGQAKAWQPARTYIQQLCEDTGCNPEDLPKVINDRKKLRERVRDIRAAGTTWWWWWWWWWCYLKQFIIYIYTTDQKFWTTLNCFSKVIIEANFAIDSKV